MDVNAREPLLLIDHIRERMGISKTEFCKEIHTTPATYEKWLKGETESYTCKHFFHIVRLLQIPETEKWLRAIF